MCTFRPVLLRELPWSIERVRLALICTVRLSFYLFQITLIFVPRYGSLNAALDEGAVALVDGAWLVDHALGQVKGGVPA